MNLKTWVDEQRGRSIAIARAVGVTQPVVSDWVSGKKRVPIERCVAIERLTMGQVSRKELRPDKWQEVWPELVEAAAHA